MKKIFLLSAFAALLGLFNSCSTDFDVAAPYKEIIVINGLLNPLDSVHYVHVGINRCGKLMRYWVVY